MDTIQEAFPPLVGQGERDRTAAQGAIDGAKRPTMPWRAVKIGTAGVVLMAGAYGLVSDHAYINSTTAVVSGYVTTVRTPIDGTLTLPPLEEGQTVHRNALVGSVENPRLDAQREHDLEAEASLAQSQAAAEEQEEGQLHRERTALETRTHAHAFAVAARIEAEAKETDRLLAERTAVHELASRELERGKQLFEEGISSRAAYEQLVAAQRMASESLSEVEAQLAKLHQESRLAARGLYSEAGANNDVAYSQQRVDEVDLRLLDTARERRTAAARAQQEGVMLTAQSSYLALMRHADLLSPVEGTVLALDAVQGEHVSTGEPVAEMVNCQEAFLLATVPQERVPQIEVGSVAHFRLSGESKERTATVAALGPAPESAGGRKLAILPPLLNSRQSVLVRLNIAGEHVCSIGRTASVSIPAARKGGVFGSWLF